MIDSCQDLQGDSFKAFLPEENAVCARQANHKRNWRKGTSIP
jgi:hypothetical protein